MRARAIRDFLVQLSEGDPVALGFVIGFLVLGTITGLYVLKVKRDLRKEDEAQARKYGRKLPK
jgi:hypothetical protein